jgi:GNAT superfamily N-acetyltransferase
MSKGYRMSGHPGGPATGARSIVIVGGGPRGSGLLERLVANVPELLGTAPLVVHVVEPHTLGAGRIWRYDQSPLLWANSQAEGMTMFTDASCRIDGPVVPGPTFLRWAALPHPVGPATPELEAERAGVRGLTFPTRRLLTEYLAWGFWRTVRQAPENVTVQVHTDRAVDVTDTPDGRQLVHLQRAAEPLVADTVLLAQGHLFANALGAGAHLAQAAAQHGLTYLPEDYTADSDLSVLTPGQPVLVRGAGLAFIDLMVLVTEGRGGRFTQQGDRLVYHPSGREPRLFVGSRRGVPYHSKLTYRLPGPPTPHPRFLTPQAVDALLARPVGELDFRADVWPLMAKELAFGHYYQLFTTHPEAVRTDWPTFEVAFAAHPWGSGALADAVAEAVPDPADRFDPDALDRPLRGVRLADAEALQQHLVAYVEADLARRGDLRYSADLGVFNALLAVLEPLLRVAGQLSATSAVTDAPWFTGFFSYVASGPPPRRLHELLALVRAGIVSFLGADVEVTLRPAEGTRAAAFVATSATVPGEVTARALVEARIPRVSLTGTTDPLLRTLQARGAVSEATLWQADTGRAVPTGRLLVAPGSCQVVDVHGHAHPARHAFGAGTSAATAGAFSRPGTNAAYFRQNDRAARHVLVRLAALGPAPRPQLTGRPALTVEYLAPDHVDAEALLGELVRDYAARYPRGQDVVYGEPAQDFTVPDGAWIVLRDAGRPVAAGAYRRLDDETVELKRIWTHPARRGQGLGRRLVMQLEQCAARRGFRRVHVTTGTRQPEAERLYASLGYTARRPDPDDPRDGPPGAGAVFDKDLAWVCSPRDTTASTSAPISCSDASTWYWWRTDRAGSG